MIFNQVSNLWILPAFLLGLSCQTPEISPLEKALWSAHPALLKVLHDPAAFDIQILYTQIDRSEDGKVYFTDHAFRNNPDDYFYPASTIKLPVAVLALEFMDSIEQIQIDTPYKVQNDSTSHSLEDDIRQIFSVSDNDAYNRLYELLGRDYVNSRMKALGIPSFRLAHRLSVENSDRAQRLPVFFTLDRDSILLGGGSDKELAVLNMKAIKKGKGYLSNGILVNQPMDFSEKNYFPISAQHEFMKRIFFPSKFPITNQLKISSQTMTFLREQMRTLPRENSYDEQEFYDSYGKFFIYGDTKERIPKELKIYNKVGYAYGTLTDTAYIVDESNGVEFFLTATILVNQNGIFNDDVYEYESIGIPFLAQLGREMYLQERSRN